MMLFSSKHDIKIILGEKDYQILEPKGNRLRNMSDPICLACPVY